MKTSRITLAAFLLLMLATFASCEQGKEMGVAMGAEFAKAWTGDEQLLERMATTLPLSCATRLSTAWHRANSLTLRPMLA